MTARILVLGNATVDLIQHAPSLPRPGETVLATSLTRCAGGKGLNQALACARTGVATNLVAPIGRDPEAMFLRGAMVAERQLVIDWLAVDAPTDLSSILVSRNGENMIASSAQAARSLSPDDVTPHVDKLLPGEILLLQGNLSAQTTLAAAAQARRHGARVILNTAPIDWDMTPLLPYLQVIIANEVEAAELLGPERLRLAAASEEGTRAALDEARLRARALRGLGCAVAIITLGARGAVMATGTGTAHMAAPPVAAVDTAGAGDVTVGTFAGLLAQGASLEHSLTTAVAAASLSVTRLGTTPSFPTPAEIRDLSAMVRV